MEQTILFCVLALALCQTVFLLNHRYLLRGAIFSAATGVGCLAALSFLFPAAGLPVWLSALSLECRAAIFLLLIKLICRL